MDGSTTGPDSFSGPLAKEASGDIHKKDIVAFAPITSSLPEVSEEVTADLSRDQKLLYQYVKAIVSGVVGDYCYLHRPGTIVLV